MLFNSFDFALFLPLVFIGYWFVFNRSTQLQNYWVVFTSYFFYGYWDWRFLLLIFTSTCIDFFISKTIDKSISTSKKRRLLLFSILSNIGLLCYFKYVNFFIDNFNTSFTFLGAPFHLPSLEIILPVGISFYTFQTLSYTIDVYRNQLKPSTNFIAFTAFVSFFPQLVAGPIERAKALLPQFTSARIFNYEIARKGVLLIFWGLFKKIVIADNCAFFVDQAYNNIDQLPASALAIAAVLFAFQIYGDFSGYSDMAIGIASLFNIHLNQNFKTPYFAQNIQEFWQKWHISLTTWFRDYIYFPLGGNKASQTKTFRNIFLVFLVSGFWHGANWTFILWAFIHILLYLSFLSLKSRKTYMPPYWLSIVLTFILTTFAWIFFRSSSVETALHFIQSICSTSILSIPTFYLKSKLIALGFLILLMQIIEFKGKNDESPMLWISSIQSRNLRWGMYVGLLLVIGLYAQTNESPFIYFQF